MLYIYSRRRTNAFLFLFTAICRQMLLLDGNVTVFTGRITIPRLIIGRALL